MKTFFEKKSLEPRLSNYKDYYYKYKKEFLRNSFALERSSNKALKYYLKNNSIEKQKRTKGGVANDEEDPPRPQLPRPQLRRGRFDRENVIRDYVERAIRELQLTHLNYNDAAELAELNIERYINDCNRILREEGADEVENEEFRRIMNRIIRADLQIEQIQEALREQENRENRQAAEQGYNRGDGADGF